MNSKKTLKKNRNSFKKKSKKSKKLNSNIKYRKLNKQYTKKKNYVGGGTKYQKTKRVAKGIGTLGIPEAVMRTNEYKTRLKTRSSKVRKSVGFFGNVLRGRRKLIKNYQKTNKALQMAGKNFENIDYKNVKILNEAIKIIDEKIKDTNTDQKELGKLQNAKKILTMDTQNIRLQSSIYVRKLLNKRINKTTEKLNNALQTGNQSKVAAILSRITNKQNIDMNYVTNFMDNYENKVIEPSDVLKGNDPFLRQLRNGIYDKSKISGQLKEDLINDLGLETFNIKNTKERIEFNFLDGKYVIYDKDGNQRPVTQKDIDNNNNNKDIPEQIKRDLEADLNKTSFENDVRKPLDINANKFLSEFSKINIGDYKNANELLENNPGLNKFMPTDEQNRESIMGKLNDRFFKAVDEPVQLK